MQYGPLHAASDGGVVVTIDSPPADRPARAN